MDLIEIGGRLVMIYVLTSLFLLFIYSIYLLFKKTNEEDTVGGEREIELRKNKGCPLCKYHVNKKGDD